MNKKNKTSKASVVQPEPLMVSFASESPKRVVMASGDSETRTRRNRASTITKTDKFSNIEDGLVPFRSSRGSNNGWIDVRDACYLCQLAYYNFAQFRNTIDLMTEFSVSDIYFKGGSKKSRDFFEALFKKNNLSGFQDRFFREYYRSGNVFTYRFEGTLTQADVAKITQTFGSKLTVKAEEIKIPLRYVILNPVEITAPGSSSYLQAQYYKVLSEYEAARLRVPKTEEDKEIYESLPEDVKKALKSSNIGVIRLQLDQSKFVAVFYKKQDYEPFGVPMGYPVLEDLNYKAELKKMDAAIARTIQQAILLVTMGAPPEEGGINAENLKNMQKLFENQSVGRVLIADYTTKAQFVIPQIADILDPKKYEVINEDINLGLNNILVGGEKFSNQQSKIDVFLARLNQGRKAFINDFLIPEIRRISKMLGFKNYPTPFFEEITLKDNSLKSRIYTRLLELGILTPEEVFRAIETGVLPDTESSLEAQKVFKTYRDQELYQPLLGGPKEDAGEAGRPDGTTGIPKREAQANEAFSGKKVIELYKSYQELENAVIAKLKKKYKKKKLNESQLKVASEIGVAIACNETSDNWLKKVADYCENPIDKNPDRVQEVLGIATEFNVDTLGAAILLNAKAN